MVQLERWLWSGCVRVYRVVTGFSMVSGLLGRDYWVFTIFYWVFFGWSGCNDSCGGVGQSLPSFFFFYWISLGWLVETFFWRLERADGAPRTLSSSSSSFFTFGRRRRRRRGRASVVYGRRRKVDDHQRPQRNRKKKKTSDGSFSVVCVCRCCFVIFSVSSVSTFFFYCRRGRSFFFFIDCGSFLWFPSSSFFSFVFFYHFLFPPGGCLLLLLVVVVVVVGPRPVVAAGRNPHRSDASLGRDEVGVFRPVDATSPMSFSFWFLVFQPIFNSVPPTRRFWRRFWNRFEENKWPNNNNSSKKKTIENRTAKKIDAFFFLLLLLQKKKTFRSRSEDERHGGATTSKEKKTEPKSTYRFRSRRRLFLFWLFLEKEISPNRRHYPAPVNRPVIGRIERRWRHGLFFFFCCRCRCSNFDRRRSQVGPDDVRFDSLLFHGLHSGPIRRRSRNGNAVRRK